MSDEKRTPQPKGTQAKIENLELNRDTVQDLGETEQEGVKGGEMAITYRKCNTYDAEIGG